MTSVQLFAVLLSSCLCLQLVDNAQSYVIDGTSSSSIASRFHNTQCKLFVTIDKTAPPPDTTDDDNFISVACASKLGLPLDIQFTSSACTDLQMTNEALLHNVAPPSSSSSPPNNNNILSLQPLSQPKFVTHSGQQSVKVTPGAYACQLTDPQTNQYFVRFFLDFPDGATRNDVTLPAERVYFMSSCWIKEENRIETARKWKEEILTNLASLNREIDELLERNDENVGVVARARRIPQFIELLKQRKKLTMQIGMLEERFPLERPLTSGPNGTLLLRDGVVAVKREFGGKTRYHWIGTFSFSDFLDGGNCHTYVVSDINQIHIYVIWFLVSQYVSECFIWFLVSQYVSESSIANESNRIQKR